MDNSHIVNKALTIGFIAELWTERASAQRVEKLCESPGGIPKERKRGKGTLPFSLNSVFAGLAAGALANAAFVDGLTATRAKAQILCDEANGDLYFDADGTGGGLAVKFAQVDYNTAITTADFFVI